MKTAIPTGRSVSGLILLFSFLCVCQFACFEEKTAEFGQGQQPATAQAPFEDVSADSAFKIIKEHAGDPEFVILDVRTPGEFRDGHIEGARLLNFRSADFRSRLDSLDRDKTYVLYCRSGNRSRGALMLMLALGFQHIYHMNRGILEWQAKELPLVRDDG